jgi:hypothetical protein
MHFKNKKRMVKREGFVKNGIKKRRDSSTIKNQSQLKKKEGIPPLRKENKFKPAEND